MADVSQLTADLASLQTAVTDDEAAISSVQTFVQSQAALITNLEQQLSAAQAGGTLDLSGLEASIASLRAQNQALSAIVPAATPTPSATSGA